ncbi:MULTISPECIES: hypothetical protein [Stenotrophomonas]|jgi:hypothetical protein|uniref:Uncharacterized protein n=1 Tax=Stenotrophomonas aracearum TaxID=3003272 RepID=A0ABY9YEL4_9GAMM|nr:MULTISPECIES: hypothetical protein [unclassified Stenotrophomonas]WNH48818.1 hypothetical protein PDM28_00330 [Stenotrophomonas sp. A5588]
MDKPSRTKRDYISTQTVRAANSKMIASRGHPEFLAPRGVVVRFISHEELKAAFISASRKLRNA